MDQQRLADAFSTFARTLVTDHDLHETLYELCDAAISLLPVKGAGVMLRDSAGNLSFALASDGATEQLERVQARDGGPCSTAREKGAPVIVADVGTISRFPSFVQTARSCGLNAMFAFPLQTRHEVIGVLDLYRDQPGTLPGEDLAAAQTLADVATAVIVNARSFQGATELNRQLQHALNSRILIEQAKGIVGEQLGLTPEKAFERIRMHARRNRTRITDVVQGIVEGRVELT